MLRGSLGIARAACRAILATHAARLTDALRSVMADAAACRSLCCGEGGVPNRSREVPQRRSTARSYARRRCGCWLRRQMQRRLRGRSLGRCRSTRSCDDWGDLHESLVEAALELQVCSSKIVGGLLFPARFTRPLRSQTMAPEGVRGW